MNLIEIHPETEQTFEEQPGLALLLTLLAKKIIETEKEKQDLLDSLQREIKDLEYRKNLLLKFENCHKNELEAIFPEYYNCRPKEFHKYFLTGPINQLNCRIDGIYDAIETPHNYKSETYGVLCHPKGFSKPITYGTLCEISGLNLNTVKKLILELERRNLVEKQNHGGIYSYKILEEIYIERVKFFNKK